MLFSYTHLAGDGVGDGRSLSQVGPITHTQRKQELRFSLGWSPGSFPFGNKCEFIALIFQSPREPSSGGDGDVQPTWGTALLQTNCVN